MPSLIISASFVANHDAKNRSFADNWEFGDYEQHFGIQTVNRTTQERHYKKSFFDLVDFMKARNVE
jgi:hypothetical protein